MLVINTLCVYLLVYKLGKESLPATVSVGPFVYWVIFYFIGVCLSDKKRDYSLLWPIILIVVGFVAQIFEAKYLMSLGSQGVGLKISSWVYSAGMILLLFSSKTERLLTKDNLAYRLMVRLGTISFGVYLIHMYFVLAESALIRFDGWLMSFIAVAVLTIGFVIVLRKVIPSKYWKLLGII